jgi:hypothetical protein
VKNNFIFLYFHILLIRDSDFFLPKFFFLEILLNNFLPAEFFFYFFLVFLFLCFFVSIHSVNAFLIALSKIFINSNLIFLFKKYLASKNSLFHYKPSIFHLTPFFFLPIFLFFNSILSFHLIFILNFFNSIL